MPAPNAVGQLSPVPEPDMALPPQLMTDPVSPPRCSASAESAARSKGPRRRCSPRLWRVGAGGSDRGTRQPEFPAPVAVSPGRASYFSGAILPAPSIIKFRTSLPPSAKTTSLFAFWLICHHWL